MTQEFFQDPDAGCLAVRENIMNDIRKAVHGKPAEAQLQIVRDKIKEIEFIGLGESFLESQTGGKRLVLAWLDTRLQTAEEAIHSKMTNLAKRMLTHCAARD